MTVLHFAASLEPSRFPDRKELNEHGRAGQPRPLSSFVQAAWQAKQRLWVLDLHFVEYGLHGIKAALQHGRVTDVRILSGREKNMQLYRRELMEVVQAAWNQGQPKERLKRPPVQLHWRDRLLRSRKEAPQYPFAHDRFVIVDGFLWHFGHSAGGSSNHLSAASGPWDAVQTGAAVFFDELWRSFGDG